MNVNTSDAALLYAWQRNRDAEAFHAIVNRHARLVYNTCRHIVRNDADAADVAQECFLSLATTPPDIDRSLAGWLHRLATHRALNHLKRRKRRRDREVRYARELPDLLHPETDDLLSLIDEAIDALPDELRLPLVDNFFSRRSHQEVAISLGVPRRTVSYRINSGIEQLRTTLSKRGVAAPVAGLTALLEWQRADAEALPETLHASLSKYALAGAAARGARWFRRAAFVASGMSGTILLATVFGVALCLVLWLVPRGGMSAAPEAPPAVTDEVEIHEAGEGLASGEANTAKEAELERAAAGDAPVEGIAGKVTGRVYDADTDAPIAGAVVKIALESDTYNPVATCITDAEGRYESEGLPADAYMIYRGQTPGYGATSDRVNARGTWLSKPEPDGIRFRISKNTMIDLPVHKGLIVTGIVVDSLGNGISNATVVARARYQNNGQTTQTADDGTFFLAGFSSSYNLCMSVSKPGLGRRNFSRLDIGFPGLENLRIEMSPAARISGQLIQDDGTPIADARILAIHDTDTLRWPLGFPGADTNTEGKFSIDGLGPGRYGVQVFSGDQKIRGIDPNAVFVNLDVGQSVDNVNLRKPTPTGITVSGIVTDPNGEPIKNQMISLGVPTRTDADGRFVVAGLPSGQHQFKAEIEGYRTGFEQVIVEPSTDPEKVMQKRGFFMIDRDRDDLQLVLHPNTFTLTGNVVNRTSGEAVKYFELDTFPQGRYPFSTESWQEARRVFSENGSFRLDNLAIGPGSWSVVAWVPGFGVGFADLTI